MDSLRGNWGNRDSRDFLYQISFDFVAQLERFLEEDEMSREEFAALLGVTKGRVSQVLNNPGNLQLLTIVEWVLKLGRKVAIVAYDDGDRANAHGPINSQVFEHSWVVNGKPHEFVSAPFTETGSTGVTVNVGEDFWPHDNDQQGLWRIISAGALIKAATTHSLH